jgi:cytochrome P450
MSTSTDDLLTSFDQFDPEHVVRMHEVMGLAREQCPVMHTDAAPGYYIVTRYDDVKEVLTDWETYSSRHGMSVHSMDALPALPAAADPPQHKQYRALLHKHFTRAAFKPFDAKLRELARGFMAPWLQTGRVEFVHDYAAPFSFAVLCEVFMHSSNPDQLDRFMQAAEAFHVANTVEGYMGIVRLVGEYLEERRTAGVVYDDFIDTIETMEVTGRRLTEEEKQGFVLTMIAAGFDTNAGTMATIMAEVCKEPALEPRIQGSDWPQRSLDELLRRQCPVTHLARTVVRETTLNGVRLVPGDKVMVHYASAHWDETKFPNPEQLDFERPNRTAHMAFSYGIHRCLGAIFAEVVVGIGLDELTRVATNFRIEDGVELEYTPGMVHRPVVLPMRFDLR